MIRRTWYLPAAILWTVAIFVGTWLPSGALPHPEIEDATFFRLIPLDKIAHAGMFAGFGFLWLKAYRRSKPPVRGVLAAGLFIAVLTEVGQATAWVGRDGDVWDVLADGVGLVLGIALVGVGKALARRNQKPAGLSKDADLSGTGEASPSPPEPVSSSTAP